MNRIRIENVLTATMDARRSVGRYTITIENGRFAAVVPAAVAGPAAVGSETLVLDGRDLLAIPGLINGHLHCDVVAARGLGDGYTLHQQNTDSIVGRNRWFRDQLSAECRRLSRRLQLSECVRGGTTFVCDVPFWPPGESVAGAGLSGDGGWAAPFVEVGIGGAVVVDYRRDFLTGDRLTGQELRAAFDELRAAGLVPVIGAPPEEGFDAAELRYVFDRAEEFDTLVHMHLAETRERMALVHNRFGTTSVRFLHGLGLVNERLLASHAVYVDDEEIARCAGAGVRVVNTPVAEMKLCDGIAPVPRWAAAGGPLGIGTDGSMWNDSSDLFGEMKSMLLLHRVNSGVQAMNPQHVLELATCRGAAVFGREREIGSIEVGKRADLVLLHRLRTHVVPLVEAPLSNLYAGIVSCLRAGDVQTVIAGGRVVVKNGAVTTVDEGVLARAMQTEGERLFAALREG